MKSPDDAKRPRTVDAVLTRFAAKAPATEAFEDARPNSREDIMLDVRLRDGSRMALSYAFLLKVKFLPGDTLRLHFDAEVLSVKGRRLIGLYESLLEHRAKFIQEGNDEDEDAKPEEAPHIELIEMENADDTRSFEENERRRA